MFGKVFKTRSHYVFDYKPRYYDERKERIKRLEEKYSKEMPEGNDEDIPDVDFSKNNLRKAWKKNKTKPSDKNYTKRLVIIITLLVGIVAYIFELHKLF